MKNEVPVSPSRISVVLGRYAMPVGNVQHLPDLDVVEVAEELQSAQRVELLRVGNDLLGRLQIVEHTHQILGELLPGLVALLQALLQHLLDDVVDRRQGYPAGRCSAAADRR